MEEVISFHQEDNQTPQQQESSQIENSIEQMIQTIFQEERKYNRVMKEIVMLNSLDEEFYDFQIEKVCTGLKIIVTIKQLAFGKTGLTQFNIDKPIIMDIILTEGFPFDAPKIFCMSNFCIPSLADGRDFLEDILKNPYMSSVLLDQVVQSIPTFITTILKNVYDNDFITKLGDYYIGDIYNIEEFDEQNHLHMFEATEIIQKQKNLDRILILTDINLLSFQLIQDDEVDEQGNLIKTFAQNGIRGRLVNFYQLNMLKEIKQDQKNKQTITILNWKTQNKNKKSSQSSQSVFNIEKTPEFIESIQQITKNLGNSRLLGKKKQSFTQDQLTEKQYENMDIEQVISNITILEEELQVELSVSSINLLTNLYGRAIEYLSAKMDDRFQIYMDRMQDLLTREDIQALLQWDQEEKEKSKSQISTRKKSSSSNNNNYNNNNNINNSQNQKQQQQQKQSQNQKSQNVQEQESTSVFDELESNNNNQKSNNSSLPQSPQTQVMTDESQKNQIINQIPMNNFNLNLLNTKRFCQLIDSNNQFLGNLGYQIDYYYDTEQKKILSYKRFNVDHIKMFFTQKQLLQDLQNDQFQSLVPVLNINQDQFTIITESGHSNLKDFYLKNKKKIPEFKDILQIFKRMTLIASQFLSLQEPVFPQFSPENLVYSHTDQYRQYILQLSDIQPININHVQKQQQQQYINNSYNTNEILEELKNFNVSKIESQISTKMYEYNVIFSLARTIQRILIGKQNKSIIQEQFSKNNISTQILSQFDKNDEFQFIYEILDKILVKKEIQNCQELYEILSNKQIEIKCQYANTQFINDPHGTIQHVLSNKVKNAVQKKAENDILEEKVSLKQKYNLTYDPIFLEQNQEYIYPFLITDSIYRGQIQQKNSIYQILEDLENTYNKEEDSDEDDDEDDENQQENLNSQEKLQQKIVIKDITVRVKYLIELLKNIQNTEKLQELIEKQKEITLNNDNISINFNILYTIFCIEQIALVTQDQSELAIQNLQNFQTSITNLENKNINIDQIQNNFTILEAFIKYFGQQDYPAALKLFSEGFKFRASVLGESHPSTINILYLIAECFKQNDQFQNSLQIIGKTISRSLLLDENTQNLLKYHRFYNLKTKILHNLNQNEESWQIIKQSYDTQNKQGKITKQLIECYQLMGTLQLLDKNNQGVQLIERSIQYTNKIIPKIHPFRASLYYKIALTQISLEQYESAIKLLNEALEIRKQLYGVQHSLVIDCLKSLGDTYQDAGEFQQAQSYYQQSLDLLNQDNKTLKTQTLFLELSAQIQYLNITQKNINSAWESIQNTEQQFENSQKIDIGIYIKFLERKYVCLLELQQDIQAIEIQKQVLNLQKLQLKEDDSKSQLKYAQKILNLSFQVEKNPDQIEESIQLKQQSIILIKKYLGDNNIQQVQIQRSIAKNYLSINKPEESMNTLFEALKIMQQNNSPEDDVMKIIKDLSNICVQLAQSEQIEEAFSINEMISNNLLILYGEDSPFIEFASSVISNTLNQAMYM